MLRLGRYIAAVERLDVPDVACSEHGVRTLSRRDGIEVVRLGIQLPNKISEPTSNEPHGMLRRHLPRSGDVLRRQNVGTSKQLQDSLQLQPVISAYTSARVIAGAAATSSQNGHAD